MAPTDRRCRRHWGVLHLRRIHWNRNSVRMTTQVNAVFLLLQLREESFWPTAELTEVAGGR